jgi:hypothetical protein
MTCSAKTPFTRSSGNVFEDLHVSAPSEALAKSELAAIIRLGRDVDILVRGAHAGGRGTASGRIHVRATTGRRAPAAAPLVEAGA